MLSKLVGYQCTLKVRHALKLFPEHRQTLGGVYDAI